jgi:hypothetical protein
VVSPGDDVSNKPTPTDRIVLTTNGESFRESLQRFDLEIFPNVSFHLNGTVAPSCTIRSGSRDGGGDGGDAALLKLKGHSHAATGTVCFPVEIRHTASAMALADVAKSSQYSLASLLDSTRFFPLSDLPTMRMVFFGSPAFLLLTYFLKSGSTVDILLPHLRQSESDGRDDSCGGSEGSEDSGVAAS